MKKSYYKDYLERLMKAMNLTKEELKEFDAQIQKDLKEHQKECRIKEGEKILKAIK